MHVQPKYNQEKLLFRRQFFLGPLFLEKLKSWKRIRMRDNLFLTVHPDLNACQVVYGSKSLTLLGYVLDPDEPAASDLDIIRSLTHEFLGRDRFENFCRRTGRLGGRWILIADDGGVVRLFNDATGLRQVFYTENRFCKVLWCASQPGILAETLGLEMDKEALEFVNSAEYKRNKEYWWPGDYSPYREIKHLLPNHYLDLQTGSSHRFWPDKPLDAISVPEGVRASSQLLRGLMKSASNRFNLALALTAGIDSRLLLASMKEVTDKVFFSPSCSSSPVC
jgi:asparagine synthetase B (glutamine-hydrolysing)